MAHGSLWHNNALMENSNESTVETGMAWDAYTFILKKLKRIEGHEYLEKRRFVVNEGHCYK